MNEKAEGEEQSDPVREALLQKYRIEKWKALIDGDIPTARRAQEKIYRIFERQIAPVRR